VVIAVVTVRNPLELGKLCAALAAVPAVELALLFGSVARGQARGDSDVDVAVLGLEVDLGEVAARISEATGREAHVVRLEHATIPLLEELIAEGIVLVGREGRAAAWRSHVLADLELDRPWFRRQRDAWLLRQAESGGPLVG
jgi:predicted nucleotidyltransferase